MAERWLGARELGGAPLVRLVDENDRKARVAGAVEMLGDRPARVHRHRNSAKPPCRVPRLEIMNAVTATDRAPVTRTHPTAAQRGRQTRRAIARAGPPERQRE